VYTQACRTRLFHIRHDIVTQQQRRATIRHDRKIAKTRSDNETMRTTLTFTSENPIMVRAYSIKSLYDKARP